MLSVIVVTTASPHNINKIGMARDSPHRTEPDKTKRGIRFTASYQSLYISKKTLQKRATTSSCNINRETGTAKPMPYSAPFPEITAKAVPKQPL